MERNRERLAQVDRPAEHQRAVERDERVGHIRAGRAVDDEASDARHEKGKERHRSPLPGRHPDLIGQEQHRDEAAVGWIEHVLAAKSDDELGDDGDHRRQDGKLGPIRAEQKAERQARDERAPGVHSDAGQAVADGLRGDDGQEHDGDASGGDSEVEPPHPVDEQRSKCRNLIQARVGHSSSSSDRRTIEPGFLAGEPERNECGVRLLQPDRGGT